MVRYVKEDTTFTTSDGKEHLIRQGDRVAMYPPAIHKDPEIFEDPLVSIYILYIATATPPPSSIDSLLHVHHSRLCIDS